MKAGTYPESEYDYPSKKQPTFTWKRGAGLACLLIAVTLFLKGTGRNSWVGDAGSKGGSGVGTQFLYKQASVDEYKLARKECKWTDRAASDLNNFYYGWFLREVHYLQAGPNMATEAHKKALVVSECRWTSAKNEWLIKRVGPMKTTGGYDWKRVGFSDFEGDTGLGERLVTGHFFGPVDPDGEAIGLPPIHIHHVQIQSGPPMPLEQTSDRVAAVFEWAKNCASVFLSKHVMTYRTGDSGCLGKNGAWCYLETFPDGLGLPALAPRHAAMLYNDVRKAGSAPMTWYVETAIRYAAEEVKLTPLNRLYILQPLNTGQNSRGFHYTLAYPPRTAGVQWWGYTWPNEMVGALKNVKWHSHKGLDRQGWIIDVGPDSLGLNQGKYIMGRNEGGFLPAHLDCFGGDLKAFESWVLDKVEAADANIICNYKPMLEQIGGQLYDRLSPPVCDPNFHFKAGQQFTMLGLSENVGDTVGHQHMIAEFFYVPKDPKTAGALPMVFASADEKKWPAMIWDHLDYNTWVENTFLYLNTTDMLCGTSTPESIAEKYRVFGDVKNKLIDNHKMLDALEDANVIKYDPLPVPDECKL